MIISKLTTKHNDKSTVYDKCQMFGSYTVYVSTILQMPRGGLKHCENNKYRHNNHNHYTFFLLECFFFPRSNTDKYYHIIKFQLMLSLYLFIESLIYHVINC